MRCILKFIWTWKLFSPIHPLWDFDPEVVSFGAGGIIWCLIKTGSMSSPPHINIVFKSRLLRLSHGSNLTHDTYTLHESEIKLLELLICYCLLFSNVNTTINVSVSKVRSIDKIRMYQNYIAEKIVTAYMTSQNESTNSCHELLIPHSSDKIPW